MQLEHLGEVLTGADDRTDDLRAVQDGVEDRDLQLSLRRERHQNECAAPPQRAVGGRERLVAHGQRDGRVGTAQTT